MTLTNPGSAPLSITSITTSGDLARTTTCGATLSVGANCKINVTFTPTAVGTRGGSVLISSNAPGSPHSVSLSGPGVALRLSITSLAFGNQVVNVASAAKSVTLTTRGTAPLNLTLFGLAGSNANQFAISANTCGASLAPNATCTVSVKLTATSIGAKTASLNIHSSDFVTPRIVSLTGTGTWVQLSATLFDIDVTLLNTSAPTKSVTLTNTGSTALTMTSVTVTGTSASQYALTGNTCGATLNPSASCEIGGAFRPTALGACGATLNITNTGGSSPRKVTLAGTGI